jgi:hypothetical protein
MAHATISDIAWRGYGLRDGVVKQPELLPEAMGPPDMSGGSEPRHREETDLTATETAPA